MPVSVEYVEEQWSRRQNLDDANPPKKTLVLFEN